MDKITALLKEARIEADENRSKDVRHFAASVVEAVEELIQQLHDADEALKAVEKSLADVDYRGSYANGVLYLKQQLASMTNERDEIAAQARMLDRMVDERDGQLAAALAAFEAKDVALSAIIRATKSHVDGRDLIAELHPRHYMDIKVRRNGKDIWFEADWLSNLQRAITSHKAALAIQPDASALRQHDEALIGKVLDRVDDVLCDAGLPRYTSKIHVEDFL